MKNILLKIPLISFFGVNQVMASSLAFTTFSLESGANLQNNSSYRFNDVSAGVDAIITINSISPNATIVQIDDASGTGVDFAAFRPIIRGVSPTGANTEHSINYSITFVSADTLNSVSIDGFGLSIFDTDGDNDESDPSVDGADGDVREFFRLSGNIDQLGGNLQETSLGNGVTQVTAINSTVNPGVTDAEPFRTDLSYGETSSFEGTFGWTGTDSFLDVDNDRLYGAYFTGDSALVASSTVVAVPEPSSSILVGIGLFNLFIRRKR